MVAQLHSIGVSFHQYKDDCILNDQDPLTLVQHIAFSRRLLSQLGWLMNLEKLTRILSSS